MPQHTLSFQDNIWFDDPFGIIRFEYDLEQVFNRVVSGALFEQAKRMPFSSSAEMALYFRIDAAGCSFSTEAREGYSFLSTLDIESPYFNDISATTDDLVSKGVARELAWQLCVKDSYNEQAKLPLPEYYQQLPLGYWEHLLLAATNALIDHLLLPQAELATTCTRPHWEQIEKLLTKLAKITRHSPANAVVYRCTLFTAADETGISLNADDWEQATELELQAEEPYATFLHRDTAADLRHILAACGLNPAIATKEETSMGKSPQPPAEVIWMCKIPATLAAQEKGTHPHRRRLARIRWYHADRRFTGGLETGKTFTNEIAHIFLVLCALAIRMHEHRSKNTLHYQLLVRVEIVVLANNDFSTAHELRHRIIWIKVKHTYVIFRLSYRKLPVCP